MTEGLSLQAPLGGLAGPNSPVKSRTLVSEKKAIDQQLREQQHSDRKLTQERDRLQVVT